MSLICMRMNPAGNTFSQKWFYKKNRFDTGLKSLCHNDFQYKESSWFPFFSMILRRKLAFCGSMATTCMPTIQIQE